MGEDIYVDGKIGGGRDPRTVNHKRNSTGPVLTPEQWEAMYGQARRPLDIAEARREAAQYMNKRYSNLSRGYSEGGTITPRGQAYRELGEEQAETRDARRDRAVNRPRGQAGSHEGGE